MRKQYIFAKARTSIILRAITFHFEEAHLSVPQRRTLNEINGKLIILIIIKLIADQYSAGLVGYVKSS